MFRRFMIVCWILFGLASIVAVGTTIEASRNESLMEAILESATKQGLNVYEVIDPPNVEPGDVVHMERPWELFKFADDYRVAKQRKESFSLFTIAASIVAGSLFLWNILWHTGHWILMGRQSDG